MENYEILFVDDEPELLESIKIIFDLEGISVHYAESGEAALKAINEKNFKMIFTDFNMPGINGLEFTRIVKGRLPSLPVYLLTGNVISPELAAEAFHAGITKILTKPIAISCLLEVVREDRSTLGFTAN